MQLSDKAKGTIIGLACGDALGALVEYIPHEFKKYVGKISNIQIPLPLEKLIASAKDERTLNRLQNYIEFMVLPGLYTDDTQQAIFMAYSLITQNGASPADLTQLFVQGARLNGYGDYGIFRHAGPGFREAVNNMINFKKIEMCGAISAGNGAAMRIAPLGVFYYDNIDQLLRAIIEMSLPTHRDIRGIAAAGIVAFTVAHLLDKTSDTFNSYIWLKDLEKLIVAIEEVITLDYPTVKHTDEIRHQASASIKFLSQVLDKPDSEAIATLDSWAKTTSNKENVCHHSPFALASVLYSLFLFIKYYLDIKKAILTGVNGGGDSDTIAAMTGTMIGSLHGYDKIPAEWIDNIYNISTLQELGAALISGKKLNINPLEIEKDLCRKEEEYRSHYRKLLHNHLGFS